MRVSMMKNSIATITLFLVLVIPWRTGESRALVGNKTLEQIANGLESQSLQVQLLGQTKTIRVLYKPEGKKREYAKLILDTATGYIPRVAEYLGAAPITNLLTITDITDGSTARNEGVTVYIPFAYPDPELPIPAPLLYHEIGHWWFGQEPRWISEGVSSFLPIAMYEAGFYRINNLEVEKIHSWWGLRNAMPKNDYPLGDKPAPTEANASDFPLYYEKSYKLQYVILRELGAELYQKFLMTLMNPANKQWNDYFIAPSPELLERKTEGALELLKRQKPIDWDKKLSGWLGRRIYSAAPATLFKDTDGDGLLDIDEAYFGTNARRADSDADGLGDKAELALGTDPKKRNDKAEFKSLIEAHGIVFDGNGDDWAFIDATVVSHDAAPQKGETFPFEEFRYFIKNQKLYGMVKTKKPLLAYAAKNPDSYFFFADASDNKERTGFGFKCNVSDVYGWEFERKRGVKNYVWGKMGSVFEFQIDLAHFPESELKLIPLINGKSGPSHAIWMGYKPIVIKVK